MLRQHFWYHIIVWGRKRASSGKPSITNMTRRRTRKKGKQPFTISINGYSGRRPWRINKLKPIGGVSPPHSRNMTIITPYQMGSNPSARTIGKVIGRVIIMRAKLSISIPKTKYMATMPRKETTGGAGMLDTKVAIAAVVPLLLR